MNERLQNLGSEDIGFAALALGSERKEVGKEWWFEPHPLVLKKEATILGKGVEPEVMPLLAAAKENLYSAISDAYLKEGCAVWNWQEGNLAAADGGRPYPRPEEPIAKAMMINPVFLGKLPTEVELTLSYLCRDRPPFFDGRSEDYKRILRKLLPETKWPLIRRVGKGIGKALNVERNRRLHPNFTNMIFIEDQGQNIKNLPDHWQKYLGWSLMAKLGAFKNIIVPYQIIDGQLKYDLILNSLEGAHPRLSLAELPRRLMAFGSAQEMGEWEQLRSLEIRGDFWRELPEVKGLMAFSRFCGENNLLSAPVELEELVKRKFLGKLLKKLAGYSRQAEGAFVAFVPSLNRSTNELLGLPWNGFHLATISGKFGAVKTDLTENDFAAVAGFFEGGKVGVLPVEGIDLRGPSIEAFELIGPQMRLAEGNGKQFLIHLRETEEGFFYDPQGELIVPGVRIIFHSHRLYRVLRPEKVLVVPVSREEFPPFPCGSNKMHELSLYGMRKALQMWEAGGRQAMAAVVELPNHGSHLMFFWTADEEGIIPKDPSQQMKEVFEKKYLLPLEEVEQK